MYILAVRAIKPGEELTIDYRWAYTCISQRQATLKDSYGFTCTCRSCTSDPDLTRPFVCLDASCLGSVCPVGSGLGTEAKLSKFALPPSYLSNIFH